MAGYGCDTWVVGKGRTSTGTVIFAKNSDRPRDDCQPLQYNARTTWPDNASIRLAYREIPQVKVTHATIGSSPYWCWGYEGGVNEYGVAIGNEAIYTKSLKADKAAYKSGSQPELGLLGMDLVRLGLERGKTAEESLQVITKIVSEYGQWGSGFPGIDHPKGSYDNSFLIADGREAWILETVGKRWIAKKVMGEYASISNGPTIGNKWDLASEDIVDYAIKEGWWPERKSHSFNFAAAYTDRKETFLNLAGWRLRKSFRLLGKNGKISPHRMMEIATAHFPPLCMHKLPSGVGWVSTASSMIAILPTSQDRLAQFWWTPGPPCNGVYVPFFIEGSVRPGLPDGSKIPAIVSAAGTAGKTVTPAPEVEKDRFSGESYWWLFRNLMDKRRNKSKVRESFAGLQKKWEDEIEDVEARAVELKKSGRKQECSQILDDFTSRCVDEVLAIL